jgi:two-component system sensor kinase FixL
LKFLAVRGRVVEAIKGARWETHPLGQPENWPPALRAALFTLLNAASPKMLLWGEALYSFYNDVYAELTGEGACSRIAMPYAEFRPGMWPRVKASVAAARQGRGSVVQEFSTVIGEEGARAAGVYQLAFSPVLDDAGLVGGVLIDIFDITARKALEQNLLNEIALLNDLFSSTPVLIAYAAGPDLVIEYANSAFSKLFDQRPLVGLSLAEAIPEAADQGIEKRLRVALETGKPWRGCDTLFSIRRGRGRDPKLIYADFVYQPIATGSGEIAGILFSGYDMTARRLALDETDRLRHQLLHSSRMSAMGTMAVTIAHELNQPLTAAANYLASAEYFLHQPEFSDTVASDIATAREQLLRAGTIVRRMRSLVTCGQARSDAFDLEASIERAIELARASGNLDGFAVELDVAADARQALGDEIQIEQVLVNLLRNAAQASSASPRRAIRIHATRTGDAIELRLRDWGPGLPPERVGNLFGAIEETRSGDGLGVGLSLSRTIIEAHGGRMWGDNAEGGGALFGFTLPAATDEGAAALP